MRLMRAHGAALASLPQYRAASMVAALLATSVAVEAQPPGGGVADSLRPAAATVSGLVYDSIAGRPLAGLRVELVTANDRAGGRIYSAISDSSGRYAVHDLPFGRYLAGFFDVGLDTLGFENAPRLVELTTATRRVDLATPSMRTLVSLICPGRTSADSSGLLVGHVRHTGGSEPLVGAGVTVEWREIELDATGIRPRDHSVTARTGDTGWFAVCGVPAEASLHTRAGRGTDSSGYVEVELPPSGLRHVTFHVGGGAKVLVARQDTSVGSHPQVVAWRGRGRLSGTVRDAKGEPLAGAHAVVWGTHLTATTGEGGAFVLEGLPGGTQTLTVSGIGHVPSRTIVELAESRPATVDVRLERTPTMLEAVQIRDRATVSRGLAEFERRNRAGIGTFLSGAALEKYRFGRLADVLRRVPGVIVDESGSRTRVMMRGSGTLVDPMFCTPSLYVDRGYVGLDDFDQLRVEDIVAIEVYPRPAERPFEFIDPRNACGAVVVWTRTQRTPR